MPSTKKETTKKVSKKAPTGQKIYWTDWFLNPLAHDERVIESSFNPTEIDVDGGKKVRGNLTTFTEHDKGNSLKIFLNKENKDLVLGLTPRAMKIYVWIIYTLKNKTDRIFIPEEKCCEELNMTENTYRAAINDLLKAGIIYRIGKFKTKGYYEFYICPLLMFRGRRFAYYREFLDRNHLYEFKDKNDGSEEI